MTTKLNNLDVSDMINALDTAYITHNFQPLIEMVKPSIMFCENCEEFYSEQDGRYYKYEQGKWLCDSCHDAEMEDE